MIDAYPLCWPATYPRQDKTTKSRFKTTLAAARDYVKDEVRRLGGKDLIISSNIPLKDNGDLRADWTRYKLDDHGVAVYFMRNKQQVVLCCDNYGHVWENLHAIGRTIEALRQINRDGVSDFLNRSFTGFKAISEATSEPWYKVLEIELPATEAQLVQAYRRKAWIVHPDRGGTKEDFLRIRKAYDEGLFSIKPTA